MSDRGFALLIVLWWTALLALLGTQLVAGGRLEAMRASNVRAAAVADAAAESVLQQAIFRLLDGSSDGWLTQGWSGGRTTRTMPVPNGTARVDISSENGKIGLNVASARLIAALLVQLGVDPSAAARLGDAVLDWRTATRQRRPLGAKAPEYRTAGLPYAPPNADFETIDELGLVRGMTPALLDRLAPYLSAYQTGDPELALAEAPVRLALANAGEIAGSQNNDGNDPLTAPVMLITVSIEIASGAKSVHHTVLRLAADAARRPFQILDEY